MSLALFATYVLTSPDNILSPDKVFVTFSIINILQFPISQLPRAVNQISQAVIAVNRITRFLMLEEKDDDVVMYDEYMGEGQEVMRQNHVMSICQTMPPGAVDWYYDSS